MNEEFNLPAAIAGLLAPEDLAAGALVADDTSDALRLLFESDRADRSGRPEVLATDVEGRDRERLRAVVRAVLAGGARTADDYYHCATVLQHGPLVEHQHLAHELARRAADAGHGPARWLAAAAMDRWLMRKGLPQHYGTQYCRTGTEWALYDLDPATPDDERAAWDVPPLAELRAFVDELNAGVV